MTRRLADLPSDEVARRITPSSILVQPLGAIEHHGPHLPLSTDLVVVEAFAEDLLTDVGDELDVWMLPALPYTKSNEHAWSAGTVWLAPETLMALVRDLGRSLAALAARRIVFLNGHGGNTSLLDVLCRELRISHGFLTFLLHPNLPADHGGPTTDGESGFGIHGGAAETSLMLHLRPELVRMDRAVSNVPTWLDEYRHVSFSGDVGFGWVSRDFGPSGLIGDATMANAELGADLVAHGRAALAESMREIARFQFPDDVTTRRS